MNIAHFHHIYLNPFYLLQKTYNIETQLVKVQKIRDWVVPNHKWDIYITSSNPETLESLQNGGQKNSKNHLL